MHKLVPEFEADEYEISSIQRAPEDGASRTVKDERDARTGGTYGGGGDGGGWKEEARGSRRRDASKNGHIGAGVSTHRRRAATGTRRGDTLREVGEEVGVQSEAQWHVCEVCTEGIGRVRESRVGDSV